MKLKLEDDTGDTPSLLLPVNAYGKHTDKASDITCLHAHKMRGFEGVDYDR